MVWLYQLRAILWKELLVEWRTRAALGAMGVFGALVLFLFHFAFPPENRRIEYLTPGVMWITFLFSLLLGLNRTMSRERENGCMEAQLLAPVDRTALFAAKFLSNFLFLGLLQVWMMAVFALFFSLAPADPLHFGAVALLGSVGLVTVGTLFSAMAVQTQLAELLLTLMMVPLTLPVLIGAVKGTAACLVGDGEGAGFWLDLLLACDALYLIMALVLYSSVVEE